MFCAGLAWAQGDADRSAIQRVVSALNDIQNGQSTKPVSDLLTADADSRELDRLLIRGSRTPLSELAPPGLAASSIRFITPEVALADVVNTQAGSVSFRRLAGMLVMRKDKGDWRIAAVRVLTLSLIGLTGSP